MRLWQKYAVALLFVALVPLAVTTWQIVTGNVNEVEGQIRDTYLATADAVKEAVASRLARAESEVRAAGRVLADRALGVEARVSLLQQILMDGGGSVAVAIYAKDGKRILPPPQAGEVHGHPVALGVDTRKISELEGRLVMEAIEGEGGAPLVPIVQPIRRDDELYAFARAAVDMSDLCAVVSEQSKRRFGKAADYVWIVDAKLRVIASHDRDRLWEDASGHGLLAGIDQARLRKDVAQLVHYEGSQGAMVGELVPLPDLEWGVIVEDTRDHAYAAVDRIWRTTALFGGLFAILALVLGLVAARRMAAPVVAVSRAAQKVAGGDFAVRVAVGSKDEVGELAGAFNEMAEDLGDYRDKLVEETRVRGNLSRFLSPEVVEDIVAGGDQLKLGGERKQITVMFADVVSFTSLVDEHEPEFVVGILNELFTIITEIVFKHGGIIDKFIGDCAMAIWGAPQVHEDDPRRAVRAAEEILRWLEVGNGKWRKQLGRDVEIAIGIHTGEAVVGNVGSEKRMEYTAIGDVVNVAARLERLARPGQILITKDTMSHISGEFEGMSLGGLDIVGSNRTSEIFVVEE